jgi:hypothetical protein
VDRTVANTGIKLGDAPLYKVELAAPILVVRFGIFNLYRACRVQCRLLTSAVDAVDAKFASHFCPVNLQGRPKMLRVIAVQDKGFLNHHFVDGGNEGLDLWPSMVNKVPA